MQNRLTGTFGTTQVGAMLNFRKVNDEYGISLIGEARIPKREHVICERVIELYEQGELNFSFEIRYTEDHIIKKDGVTYIDAAEHNVITGMAIVSVPAYSESFALSLVAEDQAREVILDEEGTEGVEIMDEAEKTVAEQTEVEEEIVVSEETKPEETTEAVAEVTEEATDETATEETVAEKTEEPEDEEKPDEDEDDKEDEPKKEGRTAAELESALAESEAECANWHAQYMAIEAEIANIRAAMAEANAEIERLRAMEVELDAFRAAKAAEELVKNQDKARAFAQKQGLDIEDTAVAEAIQTLNYTKIAELTMANEPEVAEANKVMDGFAASNTMKITGKFDRVLARG